MDINTILYAAIGGAIGGAIGTSIPKILEKTLKKKSAKTLIPFIPIGAIISLSIILLSLYKKMSIPRIIPLNINQLYAEGSTELAFFNTMKEYEPEYFSKFLTAMDEPLRNGASFEKGYEVGEAIGKELGTAKLKYADATVLRQTLEIAKLSFSELKEKNPQQCVNLFNDRPLAISKGTKSETLIKREMQLSITLIKLRPYENISINEDKAKGVQASLGKYLEGILTQNDNLTPEYDAPLEVHKRMCDIGYNTMAYISTLSDEDIEAFMKWAMIQ